RQMKRIWLHLKPWLPEDEKVLGTRPDSQIAALLGRNRHQVVARRLRLGIPNFYERVPWTRQEIKLLGKLPDKEIAKMTRHTLGAIQAKRQGLALADPAALVDLWTSEE